MWKVRKKIEFFKILNGCIRIYIFLFIIFNKIAFKKKFLPNFDQKYTVCKYIVVKKNAFRYYKIYILHLSISGNSSKIMLFKNEFPLDICRTDNTYRNLFDVIVSDLPFLNHFTSIGWSPVTLHCRVAVSPSLVETVLVVEENSGDAVFFYFPLEIVIVFYLFRKYRILLVTTHISHWLGSLCRSRSRYRLKPDRGNTPVCLLWRFAAIANGC